MKLNEKGFSAKELLAVIIIACMIIMVMVPIVLNAIEESNNRILINNVTTFIKEVDRALLTKKIEEEFVAQNGCYYIMSEGSLCLGTYDKQNESCLASILEVPINGLKPSDGSVYITGNKVVSISNVLINNLFVNEDDEDNYYISEVPVTEKLCKIQEN